MSARWWCAAAPLAVWALLSPGLVARLFSHDGTLAADTVQALSGLRALAAGGTGLVAVVLSLAMDRPRLRLWALRGGVALAATAAALVAAELALRVAGVTFAPPVHRIAVYRESADPQLVFELVPDMAFQHAWIAYRTNAAGFRGGPWPAGPCRVLLVGDSLVYGDRVAEESLVGTRLAAELGGPVVAAGVGGYGTHQERRLVELLVPRVRPERVVVLFCFNDVDDPRVHLKTSRPLTFSHEALPATFGTVDLIELALRRISRLYVGARLALLASRPTRGTVAESPREWEHCLRALSDPGSAQARWLARQLVALAELGRRLGVPVQLAVAPLRCQLPPESQYPVLPRRTVAALCAEAGLPCLDLFPDFEKHGGSGLFVDSCHFTAEGHRVAAAAIARSVPR